MTLGKILYLIIITPLETLFGFVFAVGSRYIDSPVAVLLLLSIVVNFLVLPLYKRADAIQAEANKKEKEIEPYIKHIKKVFSGDERMFMLQALYRVNGYSPLNFVKEILPVLLQVPFFIAAYHMLSNLQRLSGVSFGPIADLSKPDALIVIGSVAINLLPILMTAINIISGAVYAKELSTKNKIQIYGIALVFLVLLYKSPSGLVLYWTFNNLFSFVKNIVMKVVKHPQTKKKSIYEQIINNKFFDIDSKLFVVCAGLLLTIIVGYLIPTDIIESSTEDFINIVYFSNPLRYVWPALCISFGTFMFWGGIFYFLMSKRSRNFFGVCAWIISGMAVVNYLAFAGTQGVLSMEFQFKNGFVPFSIMDMFTNLAVLLMTGVLFFILYKNRINLCKSIAMILVVASLAISIFNSYIIIRGTNSVEYLTSQKVLDEIPLSRDGQNVVVIMLDRTMGMMVPYVLENNPELKEKLDGFVYYPNTVSYGTHTNTAFTPVVGGYEYTPYEMNKRDDVLLKDKHNEALKLMPVLFGENGFDVTVVDPTYGNYRWLSDLSVYDEYSYINACVAKGFFVEDTAAVQADTDKVMEHNVYSYGMYRMAPYFLRGLLYDSGLYNVPDEALTYDYLQTPTNASLAIGKDREFVNAFSVLENMSNLTTIDDNSKGSFLVMCNETTHADSLLDEETYMPVDIIDNTAINADANRFGEYYDTFTSDVFVMRRYQTCAAALTSLARWFDYLREQGVYDNTRIILVSDHGFDLNIWGELESENGVLREAFNPLLMVKDFNSTGFEISNEFMTNADTPYLALNGVIDNPVNPFTGNLITNENTDKSDGTVLVMDEPEWQVSNTPGSKFPEAYWYEVKENIFDAQNWKYIGIQ